MLVLIEPVPCHCRLILLLFYFSLEDPLYLPTKTKAEAMSISSIMLTCPCNVDPLTPHFYIVKLGSTGVLLIIFLFLL